MRKEPPFRGTDGRGIRMLADHRCASCGATGMGVFYEIESLPVHSVLLFPTREEALNYPKGNIALGLCSTCGFISNVAFDPDLHEYSSRYEETQGFSPTFNAFHRRLANYLIERYDLHDKSIIEIGCGKGEFLTILCELGGNRGIGFDPAFVSERTQSNVSSQITFINDFYSEAYANYQGEFVCCKMTLEHIQNTAEFVGMIRRSIGDRLSVIVFFQVPDVRRILKEVAFWDVYYEHCSYFSHGSLARLFRKCGFAVVDVWKDYSDQYLMIEARPNNPGCVAPSAKEETPRELARDVIHFAENWNYQLDSWKQFLQDIKRSGRRAVIWGSGSKGVSFLTTLDVRDEIDYVVDINPYRQGTYIAGTGQKIVGQDFLMQYDPDLIIVVNPIYCEEISETLSQMGLSPELIAL